MLSLPPDADSLSITVERDDVERGDVATTLEALNLAMADREAVARLRDSVSIFVDGYNDDPRELHEIPEVRQFFVILNRGFPYWFYFLPKSGGLLTVVALCLMKESPVGGQGQVTSESIAELMIMGFQAVNELYQRFALPPSDNQVLSSQISAYFGAG